jgi:hypothetical protein
METMITTTITSRTIEGSCNSCQRRGPDAVILTTLTTLSFRLCFQCAAELQRQITPLIQSRANHPTKKAQP